MWFQFGGFCYLFEGTEMKNFADALVHCSMRGSQLVSIHSPEETDFLVAHLQGTLWSWTCLVRAQNSE